MREHSPSSYSTRVSNNSSLRDSSRPRARARWAAVIAVVLLSTAGPSPAIADATMRGADGAPGSTVQVGIKPLDPFVVRSGDDYQGFSIDLWNEIARRNSWQTSYVW